MYIFLFLVFMVLCNDIYLACRYNNPGHNYDLEFSWFNYSFCEYINYTEIPEVTIVTHI